MQGFLAPGTDVTPIVPALEKIWADSLGQSMASFNFRSVTSKFNDLVYEYPIRIPERYSLVIRCAPRALTLLVHLMSLRHTGCERARPSDEPSAPKRGFCSHVRGTCRTLVVHTFAFLAVNSVETHTAARRATCTGGG